VSRPTSIDTYHQLRDARFRELDNVVEDSNRRRNEMNAKGNSGDEATKRTTVEGRSDREVVITRSFDAPAASSAVRSDVLCA
jgi:hypothetical protein